MPTTHQTAAGECISSIALEYGFFPDTLWNEAKNSALKEKRKNPNTLCAGDEVFIPDKKLKEMSEPAAKRHRFRRKGVPEVLRLQFFLVGQPRANEKYLLDVDGQILSKDKRTDADGKLEHYIPPDARMARIFFRDGAEEYTFALGQIEPVSTLRGVQGRLKSLGFYDGQLDGEASVLLNNAVARFQASQKLPATGEVDDQTKQKLVAAYGG